MNLVYIAALSLFDGHIDIRSSGEKRNYELVIADMSKEYLEEICYHIKREFPGTTCRVYPSRRDRALRLRAYGKELVFKLIEIQKVLVNYPKEVVAAAIDAEGSVSCHSDQPMRTRITLKNDWKAELLEKCLMSLRIEYKRYLLKRGAGRKYVQFIVSSREKNMQLYTLVKVYHPYKTLTIRTCLNMAHPLRERV